MIHELLEIGPHVTTLPIVHGSGDFAWEVRRLMLKHSFDCLAVPLPESFQKTVETAILDLPVPSVVFQQDLPSYQTQWQPDESDQDDDRDDDQFDDSNQSNDGASYVPIDPCQGVIAALRTAMGDRIPRHFVDLETSRYRPHSRSLPDAYALKKLPIERFAAAVIPHIEPSHDSQWSKRIRYQAWQLRQLSVDYENILFVCSVLDFPWIRQAFNDRELKCPSNESVTEPATYQLHVDSLYFLLGELPFITGLYENARRELEDDEHLSVDGLKELLIASREDYKTEYKSRARKIVTKRGQSWRDSISAFATFDTTPCTS